MVADISKEHAECTAGTDLFRQLYMHATLTETLQIRLCNHIQSGYIDTGPTSPSTYSIRPAIWLGRSESSNVHVTSISRCPASYSGVLPLVLGEGNIQDKGGRAVWGDGGGGGAKRGRGGGP